MAIGTASFNPLAQIRGMKPEDLTDKYLLDLHIRQLRAIGRSKACIRAREGAVWRLSKHLDPSRNTWLDCARPRAVVEADPVDLTTWQATIRKRDGSPHTPKTIRCYVTDVQAFFSWLVRPMRVITESPADDLLKPTLKRRDPRPVPEDELAYALDACTDRTLYAWLVLGAYAGLRSVDISHLRTDDVILGNDYPYLRVLGKGGDEKKIAIGMQVVKVLAPFRNGRGAMFTRDDVPVTPHQVERGVNEYLDSIGLTCTFHQFRHRYGTMIYRLTKDILYTKEQLRHESVTSTQIYALVEPGVNGKAIDALDADLDKRRRA
jgi:integrase